MKMDVTLQEKGYTQKEKKKIISKSVAPLVAQEGVSCVMAYNGKRTPNWGMAQENEEDNEILSNITFHDQSKDSQASFNFLEELQSLKSLAKM